MKICELNKEDEKAWEEYIFKHPDSTFYHQIGWKNVIENTYRHKPCYIIAKENGNIKGVLPLFLMESRIFGKKLVSLPFAPYGGVLVDTEAIKIALIGEARKITKQYECDYLEFRNLNELIDTSNVTIFSYVTFIIRMDSDLKAIWEKLRRDKKKGVKKAKKANLFVEWNTNVDTFYKIYTHNMKKLGTPVHDYEFFNNILKEFSDSIRILTIKHENKAVCCKFILFYKDTVISMWGSTLKDYQKFHPYDLANWEAIEYSCNRGYKNFDFGRCLINSGVFKYKEGWSDGQKQLYYQFYLNNIKNPPDISQSNPNRKKFIGLWKRLPLQIANRVGPMLRRNFP